MEGRTGFIEPGLADRMLIFGMAIMTGLRCMTVKPILFMTGVADRHIRDLASMSGKTMSPA